MPITISVAKHKANAVAEKPTDLTTHEIFAKACKPQLNAVNGGSLLGSSLPTERKQRSEDLLVNSNGFFQTLVKAYNEHHALVLRPDDVWHAILVQFNFYINANAEVLRAMFVEHDGTKELVVERQSVHDVGELARAMVGEIEKNVVDPTLREWALPDFSTTTQCDTTISSVLLMATLKGYFRYMFRLTGCGIPRVTLEGEREDWAKLLQRAEKFKEYGLECVAWHHMLVGVLSRFVRTFDEPEAVSTMDFWSLVADHQRGSGMDHYSGWVSAFCVWDQKGTWVGPMLKRNVESTSAPESLSAKEFWATYYGREYPISLEYQQQNDRGGGRLVLDDTPYEAVDRQAVPICYTEVDVLLVNETTGEKTPTIMTAGIVATQVVSSGDTELSDEGKRDVLKPVPAWFMFEKIPGGNRDPVWTVAPSLPRPRPSITVEPATVAAPLPASEPQTAAPAARSSRKRFWRRWSWLKRSGLP